MKRTLIMGLALASAAMLKAEELSLRQAIDLALMQNVSLRSAELRVAAAEGQQAASRGALLPQVTASGTIMRLNSLMEMGAGKVYYLPVLSGATFSPTGDIVPMALGIGESAETYSPLAIAVISGLFFSTALTLVFVPTLYVIFEERMRGNGGGLKEGKG